MTSQSIMRTVLCCCVFIGSISTVAPAGGDCDSPAVMAQYSRKIAITPADAPDPVAILITGDSSNTEVSCVSKYVQADGTLGDTAVYQLPSTWGTVYARGIEIRPLATYDVTVLCPAGQSTPVTVTMSQWADVTGNSFVNLDDLLDSFNGFAGSSFYAIPADFTGPNCVPDGVVTIDDMLYIVRAILGETLFPASCPATCPVACTVDENCNDNLFCTGVETCVNDICQAGTSPCAGPAPVCNEDSDACSAPSGRIFAVPLSTDPASATPGQDFPITVYSFPGDYGITMGLYIDVQPDQLVTGVQVIMPCSVPCSGGGSVNYAFSDYSPYVDTARADYFDPANNSLPLYVYGNCDDTDPNFIEPRIVIVQSLSAAVPFVGGLRYIGEVTYAASIDCVGTAVIDIPNEPLSALRHESFAAIPFTTDGLAVNVPARRCCGPGFGCYGNLTAAQCIFAGGESSPGPSCFSEPCELSCTNNSQCQDNNPCTNNVCSSGFCTYPRNYPLSTCCDPDTGTVSPSHCDDFNACTRDICWGSFCTYESLVGPSSCCNPSTGQMVQCSLNHDGDPCTIRECDASTGSCMVIDISKTPCVADEDCHAVQSQTCGTMNPGFCDCVCGNSIVEGQEECDEGGDTKDCDSDCTESECRDGHFNPAAGEQCDDGNSCLCDECDPSCVLPTEPCERCPCSSNVDCSNSFCEDDNACNGAFCVVECGYCAHSCRRYGEIAGSAGVGLDDVLCSLSGFANFTSCMNADVSPCGSNGVINIDDILAVLGAFAGLNPCGCGFNDVPPFAVAPVCGSSEP